MAKGAALAGLCICKCVCMHMCVRVSVCVPLGMCIFIYGARLFVCVCVCVQCFPFVRAPGRKTGSSSRIHWVVELRKRKEKLRRQLFTPYINLGKRPPRSEVPCRPPTISRSKNDRLSDWIGL